MISHRCSALIFAFFTASVAGIAVAQETHPAPVASADLNEPRFSLHGFADVTLASEWFQRSAVTPNNTAGFALGQFDLYFVSQLADNISFLGETVFEFASDGTSMLDVERVLLKYSWSDYLRLAVGRGHTALGYWNEAYHHGVLLQPTVRRPEGLKAEDSGGLLPIHFVGLELSGAAPLTGPWRVEYVGNVANGRNAIRHKIQTAGDVDRNKAVALKLSFAREGDRSFRIGPSFYRDRIPPDASIAGREGTIDGTVLGAHLVYQDESLRFLSEVYSIRNDYTLTGQEFNHSAWYSILVGRLGKWNPYIGVDGIDYKTGDLFYPATFSDLTRYLGGVRYDVSPFNAVKVEVRHDRRPQQKSNALAIQTAFTF
ncbi:MAG: hypothetical protein ACR2G6_08765 [Gemmatimonadaceae bacterium]